MEDKRASDPVTCKISVKAPEKGVRLLTSEGDGNEDEGERRGGEVASTQEEFNQMGFKVS